MLHQQNPRLGSAALDLFAALKCSHGRFTQAQLQRTAYGVMALVFASTTPLGIVIGLAIQTTYDAQSPMALGIAGVFDSISAGTPPFRVHRPVNAILAWFLAQHSISCCLPA